MKVNYSMLMTQCGLNEISISLGWGKMRLFQIVKLVREEKVNHCLALVTVPE